jgi:cell division protease FtsH
MKRRIELGLTTPGDAMEAFLEPYRKWIESVTGCPRGETLTFEFDFPFSHLALEQVMDGVVLDKRCVAAAQPLRKIVRRWETPPGSSPRIELIPARDRRSRVMESTRAWGSIWKETPIAVWLEGAWHGLVSAEIPYVSYLEKGALSWRQWVIVNRREAAHCLNLLREMEPPRRITVVGGRDIPLAEDGYDWNALVLDECVNGDLKEDYETFWESEEWFARRALPYRRGFLLYGPPGNGKTTAVRIMASHPQVTSFSFDFSCQDLPHTALAEMFEAAGDRAPSLVILEDLDRVFGQDGEENRSAVTLRQLLECLDGLGRQDGIVVVATANDPSSLDGAILKRPGRFDRLVRFPAPAEEARRVYLSRLAAGSMEERWIDEAARESERMSFAQLREAYILAGQRSFRAWNGTAGEELVEAVRRLKQEASGAASHGEGRGLGFGLAAPGSERVSPVCRR